MKTKTTTAGGFISVRVNHICSGKPKTITAGEFTLVRVSHICSKIVSEYDQEISQSQTADKLMSPRGKATQQSRDTTETNRAK